MKKSYLFLANGFEEIEAIATVDILRRGGLDVTTVSVTDSLDVTGAHGICVKADISINECSNDVLWLILPGGLPGADNLLACQVLVDMLKKHHEANGRIAAICAAPAVVLAQIGLLQGKNATSYPGFENLLTQNGATATHQRVTVDSNFVTANGPSSAIPFALKILELTLSEDDALSVAKGMLCS